MAQSFFIAMACLFCINTTCMASDVAKKTPIQYYRAQVEFDIHVCKVAYKFNPIALETDKSHKCIVSGRKSIDESYLEARKTIVKPTALAALKEYQVFAINSIQGIEAKYDEKRSNYEKRQTENAAKLDEMWVRFEIEN